MRKLLCSSLSNKRGRGGDVPAAASRAPPNEASIWTSRALWPQCRTLLPARQETTLASHDELIRSTACSLVERLKSGELRPHDLLDALEKRIAMVDPLVNALPTLAFDRAREHADRLMAQPVSERGVLAGMPVPIKDLSDVAGVRSTQGSPIFKDHVPQTSDLVVSHLEREGGIVYAKSNTPEFGAGANTFNEVFGATLNPRNLALSASGSSGGAAASLATGMAWLAHGSDMGGSLRSPASFCGVVGMRPSLGRVAASCNHEIDNSLFIQGPMARNVEDLALLLDAMSGDEPADPLSKPRPARSFLSAARSGQKPARVAYSPDLGITPVDREVAEVTRKAALRFSEAGIIVEEAAPDLSEAHDCFQVLRAVSFAVSKAELLKTHRSMLKPEVIWNIEYGLSLTAADIVRAQNQRTAMLHRSLTFFETYDLLLCPTTIVPPFPVEERYVKSVEGVEFGNYVEWLAIVYAVTLICSPALSLPCGWTGKGLPVGLQIIGRPGADAEVLSGAKLLEDILGLDTTKPVDPKPL
ncbi:MAG: amidase [Beijerinckiaceae bacterium]|nr:amidase [Beijerinckiaceae bacterium]